MTIKNRNVSSEYQKQCMKVVRTLFFLLVALLIYSYHEVVANSLPSEYRKALESAQFKRINSVKELPKGIINLIASSDKDIAEPGKEWDQSCIKGGDLPTKRLIWAAQSDDYYVVRYESGTESINNQILMTKLGMKDMKTGFIWKSSDCCGEEELSKFNSRMSFDSLNSGAIAANQPES